MLWMWAVLATVGFFLLVLRVSHASPSVISSLLAAAQQYRVDGRQLEALVVLKKARRLFPNDALASREHIAILFEMKRDSDAREIAAAHLVRSPDDASVIRLLDGDERSS